jgi:hypothetical protein
MINSLTTDPTPPIPPPSPAPLPDPAPGEAGDTLQSHFKSNIAPDEIEQVYHLKRAQPLFAALTALFHGGNDAVLLRLLVLRELANTNPANLGNNGGAHDSTAQSRADINLKLAYLQPESLETVLARLRASQLLDWDAGLYRVTPLARNVLAALDSLLRLAPNSSNGSNGSNSDSAEMGFLLSQVAGAQVMGGVSVEQLHHLLGRLVDLTEEFRDAIASGSEFRLRTAQEKWHTACDWVEKGSQIIRAITTDSRADAATHHAAQAIGRAQSALLNMQGMFSRALNQIERQRVHLGQSGLSTTDIKTWLLQHKDIAQLAENALELPVTPWFMTPAEMIDVAETELLTARQADDEAHSLPEGENATISEQDPTSILHELDDWLTRLTQLTQLTQLTSFSPNADSNGSAPVHESLLPANFALASYRASMLPLLGDAGEAQLQGATAALARLPLSFRTSDEMQTLNDPHVAAMSFATLSLEHPPEEPADEQ